MIVQDIFVGRDELLKNATVFFGQLGSSQEENLARVMTIQGVGGIGKTKLLEQIRKKVVSDLGFTVPPIVDLKATSNRSPILLIQAIAHSFDTIQHTDGREFVNFFEALNAYNAAKAQEKYDLYDPVINEFFKCITSFSAVMPTIILLDTFESISDTELEEWILEVVPRFKGRIGVILAGRKPIPVKGVQSFNVDVEKLSIDEINELARKLFDARPGLSADDCDLTQDIVCALENLTEGRPILVTLAIEWILEDVEPEEIISIRKEDFEKKIINFLTRLDKDDFREREAIVIMATAEKRFTPNIMSILTGWDIQTCIGICDRVARFSFVKSTEPIRSVSPNSMMTLHDEMLRLVSTYFDHPLKVKNKWRQYLVEQFYEAEIAEAVSPQTRNILVTEKLHYQFRYSPQAAVQYFDKEMISAIQNYEFDFCELLLSEGMNADLNLDPRDGSIIRLAQAEMLVKQYKPFEAKILFDDLLLKFDAETDTGYLSRVTGGLGACIANGATVIEANLTEAISLWTTSLEICEKKDLQERVGTIFYQLGYVYDLLGQHGEALESYGRSNTIAREIGDLKLVAKTLDDMGRLRRKRYEVQEALQLFEESLEIKKQLGDQKSMAVSYHYLGDAYRDLDNFPRALEWYDLAEKAMQEVGDNYGLCVLYGDIGWLYLLDKQYDKSIRYTDKSYYDLAVKFHFGREMAEMEHSYYHIYLDTKGLEVALPWIEKAFVNAERYSNTFIYLDGALHLIEAAYERKQYDKIPFYYQKMDELDKKGCGYRMFKGRATNILGDLAYREHNIARALDYWQEGYSIIGIHGRSRSSVMNFSDHFQIRYSKLLDSLRECENQRLLDFRIYWEETILDHGNPQTLGDEYPALTALCDIAAGDRAFSSGKHEDAVQYWHAGLVRMALHITLRQTHAIPIDEFIDPRISSIHDAMKRVDSQRSESMLKENLDNKKKWSLSIQELSEFTRLVSKIEDVFQTI